MKPDFNPQPGSYERHLQRCADNPLFPLPQRHVDSTHMRQAQQRDAQDRAAFIENFQGLLQRATQLRPQEDSQIVLQLKEDLDQAYERCSCLAGDLREIRLALKRLIELVMQAVWRGAAEDPAAQSKLREEEIARATHFQLLEQPLIADLLRPDSPIAEDQLAATLLSESETAVAAALTLFDTNQLTLLYAQAHALLDALPDDSPKPPQAVARLRQIELRLTQSQTDDKLVRKS